MATAQLPENIERPLLDLDRQVRDAVFSRGLSRLAIVSAVGLGCALAGDGLLCLNGSVRLSLLAVWACVTAVAAWHQVLRPMFRPVSMAELAALVEAQFPELKERLTSLVEFRTAGTAPGASKLMRDLMARQTVKAVERLDLRCAVPTNRSPKMALAAAIICVALLSPFFYDGHGYGLLWARFFAPWGNFSWGGIELLIPEGDQVAARGSDVPIHVEVRRRAKAITAADQTVYWLHWTDAAGASDSRRLEWDVEASRFVTTLPHVFHSVTFHATTRGAQSRIHRIHVADPPSIAGLHLDIDPPAYTGLPAKSLDGAQGEVRAAERSRITMQLKFNEPVSSAELVWPANANEQVSHEPIALPLKLAADKRSASVDAVATTSGKFAFRLKNALGLTNTDPTRTLVVDPDLPPAISLSGSDDPVAVRPDDRHVVKADLRDDHGLTTVELHLETSTGQKHTTTLPAELLPSRQLTRDFPMDLADLALTPGQAVTYRLRAVDNRPVPQPQETWTKPRTLMIQSTVTPPVDPQIAEQQQSVDDQIQSLRDDLADAKQELAALHAQTEKESLQQKNSNKSEPLDKLERQQAEIAEKLQQLAAELAEHRVTAALAERAASIAERDVADAMKKLDEAGATAESRDQLAPLSQSIDRLTAAEKQLRGLETQVAELQRLEQDLADLDRLANKSDRLAEQLDQLDQQAKAEAAALAKSDANGTPADAPTGDDAAAREERRQQLQSEGKQLADELAALLQKHPELLDAARQEQQQKLGQLAEQARQLAKPQQQLAEALEKVAATEPASAEKPINAESEAVPGEPGGVSPRTEPTTNNQTDAEKKPGANAARLTENNSADGGAKAVRDQQQLAIEATRQAIEIAREQGTDSDAAQAATEFAKQAVAASRQAQAGQLSAASEQAQSASQVGELAAKSLAPEGEPISKSAAQAADLAQRQRDVAEQLSELAPSEAAQRGAQQQGQEQLARATAALSKRLEQASEQLASPPFDAQAASAGTAQAQRSASDAQQSMERAAQALKSDDAPEAAEQAALAADQLKQAASQADAALPRPSSKPNTAVPPEVATQVTDAARELQQAQKQLSECNCNKPGSSKPGSAASPGGTAVAGTSPRVEAPAGDTPASEPGESQLAQSAEQFRQASAAMRRALHGEQDANAQAGQNKAPGQNKSSRGQQAQAGAEPPQPGEPGQGVASGGGPDAAELGQLDSQLKQQAQRNWGRLPGQLRTEIMQGANKKPHPEYAKQIKSYFEEIAKPATKEAGK